MRTRHAATDIAFYEGLVRKTAAIYAPFLDDDYEDIAAVLRIKVWRALEAYDPAKVKTQTVERYVFMCVKNQCKDLVRKRRRTEVSIEELRALAPSGDGEHDAVFGVAEHDETYGVVEDDELLIPCTLTIVERKIIGWLYLDRTQKEVSDLLGLTRAEMERSVKTIRQKMADWEPTSVPSSTTSMPVPREWLAA